MSIVELVYKGRNNPIFLTFKEDREFIDFTSVTRMVLAFEDQDIIADSAIDPSFINWTLGNGVVQFNLESLPISSDEPLPSTLVAYDEVNTDGKVIFFPETILIEFKFIEFEDKINTDPLCPTSFFFEQPS